MDSSPQIADRCGSARTVSFIATGRGGIRQGPKKRGSDRPWHDLRPTVATNSTTIQPLTESVPGTIASVQPMTKLVEANAIEVNETGAIVLVAAKPLTESVTRTSGVQAAATCGMGESR